jgi:hypothetical protein
VDTAITRLFDTAQQATDAIAELRRYGFPADFINRVNPGTHTDNAALVSAIAAGCVLTADAKVFAQGVAKGKTLVSVIAPFGQSVTAINIFAQFGANSLPAELDDEIVPPDVGWDEATPLSSALWWPVIAGGAAPLSETFGAATTSRNPAPLSSLFGLPLLSNKAAPFSSLLGLPLLLGKR